MAKDIHDGISSKAMAVIIGKSESWLRKARMRGDGPDYFKIGRNVIYSRKIGLEWREQFRRTSTSEA